MKYRFIYLALSMAAILCGAYGLLVWKLNLGVDFIGGTIAEYRFDKEISTEDVNFEIENAGIKVNSIQSTSENSYFFKLSALDEKGKERLVGVINGVSGGNFEEIRFETVGPSIGWELIRKTIYAIIIASGAILLWVAYQFKSIKYGLAAIIAMFHDTFILIGSFSILGHFFGAEVDFLVVTAVLTTLSFSVHDTIVVYDRIREKKKKENSEIKDIANSAITETMVRSLNNSFTVIFMLVALILIGGSTIKWFATALLVGTVAGTYSSPFVAVPLLILSDRIIEKFKKK